MKINKSLMLAGIVTTVVAGSLISTTMVSAHISDDGNGLIDKLVAKFNLNRDEVQAVFDEVHDQRHAEMEEKQAERLASLVEDGTITQAQADAIKEKREEIESKREELQNQNLSREEIREQMKTIMDEFKTWAEEQGIDLESIRPAKGESPRRHGHGGQHFKTDTEEDIE